MCVSDGYLGNPKARWSDGLQLLIELVCRGPKSMAKCFTNFLTADSVDPQCSQVPNIHVADPCPLSLRPFYTARQRGLGLYGTNFHQTLEFTPSRDSSIER
jgi:hypothetical protein